MGQVTRQLMGMDRDQLEGQIRIARRLFVRVFLLWAGYMVVFAVLMALVGRVVKTVGLIVARPDKISLDMPILALALFGTAVLSVVVGMSLSMRGAFDRRFKEKVRLDPNDTANVEKRVGDLLSAALPGLDGAPYKNPPGGSQRRRRLSWAGRLLILAVLLTAGVIYIFLSH